MADKEQQAHDAGGADDASMGKREGNPLEREASYVTQRATVLRPSRADYVSRRSGSARDGAGEEAGRSQTQNFREQRMNEYRERRRAHDPDARDKSERDR